MPERLPRIWIITDPDHPSGPVVPIRKALHGCPPGIVGVQLRAKRASDKQLAQWGRELRSLTSEAKCALTVNGRADIAQIAGADGVHLPELGLPPSAVRQGWPELQMIGVSRHDRAGLENAKRDGAIYAFLSPIFEVPDKGQPIGVDGFRTAIANVGIPTYGLGGIGPEDIGALLRAGAYGIAIRRAIYAAEEPAEALRQFFRKLDKRPAAVE